MKVTYNGQVVDVNNLPEGERFNVVHPDLAVKGIEVLATCIPHGVPGPELRRYLQKRMDVKTGLRWTGSDGELREDVVVQVNQGFRNPYFLNRSAK